MPDLHLIGYSIGAHIGGLVANYLDPEKDGKLGRITGWFRIISINYFYIINISINVIHFDNDLATFFYNDFDIKLYSCVRAKYMSRTQEFILPVQYNFLMSNCDFHSFNVSEGK